jgi:uncharacterized protein (TIGR03086 family)
MSGDTEVPDLFVRSVEQFLAVLDRTPDDAWSAPTPCADWDVRTLVNHLVGEERWVVPLMEGRTIAEVGDALEGDLLGPAPREAAASAGKAASAAMAEPGAMQRTVHLSFGDFSGEDYAWQVLVDHVVHTWDLAAATGQDRTLDPGLVAATSGWWAGWESAYRGAGAVGPSLDVGRDASEQDRLIASFGRDPGWTSVHHVVRRFGAAWEAWDLDAVMSLMADDAVFESTGPAPDGRRIEGASAIRDEWAAMFRATRDAEFRFEEAFVSGDRATARWTFSWTDDDGSRGHVRGADVMRVRDGRIAEKLSYVKG